MAIRNCFLIFAFLPMTSGKAFLGAKSDIDAAGMRDELQGLLGEVLGHGHGINSGRFQSIRANLAPMFRALPKNHRGRLSAQVMRYAVQRYFSQRHGWIMKGFEAHSVMANASEIEGGAHILQSKLPSYIRSTFEKRFASDGFALDDAALMVASLERLTSDEVVNGVEVAFHLNSRLPAERLTPTSLTNVLSSYLVTEMLEGSANNISEHMSHMERINEIYPHWDSTLDFVQDVAGNDAFERKPSTNPFVEKGFLFEDAVRIGQRISEEFGPWSNHECQEMKSYLADMDIHETGRVRLSDFYGKSLKGGWQFQESSEYLRQLGALDESSSLYGPQVIIPNYITGMNNCIADTAPYFSICCLNECDRVYQHLETVIPGSSASADSILQAIETMPHTSSLEGKDLSAPLREKLQQVATFHNGDVPLHGRLLAQWIHFAFPRECPYPHAAGTLNPQTSERWAAAAGAPSFATEEEMQEHVGSEVSRQVPSPDAGSDMWNFNEALLDASAPAGASGTDWLQSFLRIGAFVGMASALSVFILKELVRMGSVVHATGKAAEYNV